MLTMLYVLRFSLNMEQAAHGRIGPASSMYFNRAALSFSYKFCITALLGLRLR